MAQKSEGSVAEYKEAIRKMRTREEKKGFLAHLIATVIVVTVLTTVNLLVVPEFIWFVFPLLGMSTGLTMHYVFGVRKLDLTLNQEEAKIQREMN